MKSNKKYKEQRVCNEGEVKSLKIQEYEKGNSKVVEY